MLLANNIVVQQKTSKPMSSVKDIEELFKNYWKTYEESPLVGRDNILASICPQVILFNWYSTKELFYICF